MAIFREISYGNRSFKGIEIERKWCKMRKEVIRKFILNNYTILYRSNRPGSRRPSERVIITIYGNQPDKDDYAHLPEWTKPRGVNGESSVIFRVGFYVFQIRVTA